jgi:hypothetical protein
MKKLFLIVVLSALTLLGADLTGTWTAAVVLDAGSGTATFEFKQTGEKLTGTYTGTFGSSPLTGTVKGNKVEWSFDNEQAGKITYTGTMDGEGAMKGTVVYGQVGSGTFTAKKK